MTQTDVRPSLLRQLMMMLYDIMLLLSAILFATIIPVALNNGEAISPGNPLFLLYLLLVCLLFYGWFWTHGGQTLGMRAWKVYLVSNSGDPVSWTQATIRFVVAIFSFGLFGMGFLWQWFGKEKQSWHETMSGTRLILVKSDKKSKT